MLRLDVALDARHRWFDPKRRRAAALQMTQCLVAKEVMEPARPVAFAFADRDADRYLAADLFSHADLLHLARGHGDALNAFLLDHVANRHGDLLHAFLGDHLAALALDDLALFFRHHLAGGVRNVADALFRHHLAATAWDVAHVLLRDQVAGRVRHLLRHGVRDATAHRVGDLLRVAFLHVAGVWHHLAHLAQRADRAIAGPRRGAGT